MAFEDLTKTNSPMSYCRKIGERKLQKMKSESNIANILLKNSNGSSLLISIPSINSSQINVSTIKSPINSKMKIDDSETQVRLPFYSEYLPKMQKNAVDLSIKTNEVPNSMPNSPEMEENNGYSLYEYPGFRNRQRFPSSASASSDDLPTLPSEPQDLSIATLQKATIPEQFKMYILPDEIGENFNQITDQYIDCTEIMDVLMVLLTELFDWGNDEDFKKYKRDSSDPIFNILNYYNKDDKENIGGDKVNHVSTPSSSKRKRKPKVFSEEYYCEAVTSPKTKIPKLEITPPQNESVTIPSHNKQNYEPQTTPSSRNKHKYETTPSQNKHKYEPVTQIKTEMNPTEEMVILGPNGTVVSAKQFNTVKWISASTATRKLLTLIFTNEILASHSLTGRPSPAFIGRERPLKEQLNPDIIQDIIYMVQLKTNGKEREIRAAITTKCADTAKMFRMLQKNKIARNSI